MTQHIDTEIDSDQGRVLAAVADLHEWEQNPREINEPDLDRLKAQIEELGQYKPLLVSPGGAVIGGNMRLRALQALDEDHVWVNVLDVEDEDGMLEYAFSDNDRVGWYDVDETAQLVSESQLDVSRYKVDFHQADEMLHHLAPEMDEDELVALLDREPEDDGTDPDDPDDAPADAADGDDSDGGDAPPRSLENIGTESSTSIIQLYMSGAEKQAFEQYTDVIQQGFDAESTTDAVYEAVHREHEDRC